MPPYSSKIDQINLTLKLLNSHDEVCHITCFPKAEELLAFKNFNKRFILIDTGINQCKTNILIRSRPRDLINLKRVFKANRQYQQKYRISKFDWEMIKVFK